SPGQPRDSRIATETCTPSAAAAQVTSRRYSSTRCSAPVTKVEMSPVSTVNPSVSAARFMRHHTTPITLLTVLALSACASSGADTDGDGGTADLRPVSFALDWAPNTNHVGVYVAEELGYFTDAGLKVTILPYASTPAVQLVSAGEADFGIGGQASVQMARTSGLDVISVYRVTQTDTGRLVVLGVREAATRPADLDGVTFGGFGAPLYSALARATIQGDGGEGAFTEVALDTGAYEALSQGRVDFTLSVATWENIQAELDE